MYFVCVYPGCKTLLPKVIACEGPLIMMTGSLSQKKKIQKQEEKRGCSLIRACSLIRSNTVYILNMYAYLNIPYELPQLITAPIPVSTVYITVDSCLALSE